LDPSQVYLREKHSEKLTMAYLPSKVLSQYNMHDDKELAIQVSEGAEVKESHYLCMVKVFEPDTWQLSAPKELWIDKMSTLKDFAAACEAAFGISNEKI